jgi:hypothetical protein
VTDFFDRMNKITELGGLVWLDRIFQHTSGKNFFLSKKAERISLGINHGVHGEHGGEATSSRRFSLREWRGVKRHNSRKRTYGDLIFSLLIPARRNPARQAGLQAPRANFAIAIIPAGRVICAPNEAIKHPVERKLACSKRG